MLSALVLRVGELMSQILLLETRGEYFHVRSAAASLRQMVSSNSIWLTYSIHVGGGVVGKKND